jgi:hypothetical protein
MAHTKSSTAFTEIPTSRSGRLTSHTTGYRNRASTANGQATTSSTNHSRNVNVLRPFGSRRF